MLMPLRRLKTRIAFCAALALGLGSAHTPAQTPSLSGAMKLSGDGFPQVCAFDNTLAPRLDRTGSRADEQRWLRSHMDENYLWRSEIPSVDPTSWDFRQPPANEALQRYFYALLTPRLDARGQPKDRWSFSLPTFEWKALTESGAPVGVGMEWVELTNGTWPPDLRVARVHPGGPAALARVRRGDRLLAVNGRPVADSSEVALASLNELIFAPVSGRNYTLTLRGHAPNSTSRQVTLRAGAHPLQMVQAPRILRTRTGAVGYLAFHDHYGPAQAPLVAAFRQMAAAGVDDLVLDLRYNSGGLLAMASQVAYMIAGHARTAGKIFERGIFNERLQWLTDSADARLPFLNSTLDLDGSSMTAGRRLPQLGLRRVFVLTSAATCSASESIINGLRGVGVQVRLIGTPTCGKPYLMLPAERCGMTYLPVIAYGVNDRGATFTSGLAPTCRSTDDLGKELGNPAEGLLATALALRETGRCPAAGSRSAQSAIASADSSGPVVKQVPHRGVKIW